MAQTEEQRAKTRDRVQRYRDKQKSVTDVTDSVTQPEDVTPLDVTPTAEDYARVYPGMTEAEILAEEAKWRKVNERGSLSSAEMTELLKWAAGTQRIRFRDAETAKAAIGPTDEELGAVIALVDAKHGAGSLMRLSGAGFDQQYSYSKDWYK